MTVFYELHYEKPCFLHMRNQMRGSRVADQRLSNVLLLLQLYLNAKVFQSFYIRVFFSMVHVRIFI